MAADFILSAFADESAESLKGQIAALLRNGISHIEVRNVDKKCIIDYSPGELKEIRKSFDDNGIWVSAIGSPIGKIKITDPFAPHLEAFRRALEVANLLGTKRIRMFSFYIPEGEEPFKYQDEVFERIKKLLDEADKAGIWCCHENEKAIFGDISERVQLLHRQFGERLRGIFDPANYIQCGEKPAEIIDALLPTVDYMHIKDADFADGSVVPAGKGDGELPLLLQKLYQKGSGRILSVEPHLTVFGGLKSLQNEPLLNRYTFASGEEAFDAAVGALKKILEDGGYSYE